jgi:fibronectin-binding autotransporter adhesin
MKQNWVVRVDYVGNGYVSSFSGVISSVGTASSLTKTGPGLLVLSGANTYTGGTTVTEGELRVSNTAGSGTGAGAVTLALSATAQSATLSGKGTISGAVTVSNYTAFSPGSSGPGLLTTGDLSFASASSISYDLDMPNVAGPAGNNDLTVVNGNLSLAGQLRVVSGANFGVGTYTLFTYTGTLTNNGLTLISPLPNVTLDTSNPGTVNLHVNTSVPAMSDTWGACLTALLVAMGSGAASRNRRRDTHPAGCGEPEIFRTHGV